MLFKKSRLSVGVLLHDIRNLSSFYLYALLCINYVPNITSCFKITDTAPPITPAFQPEKKKEERDQKGKNRPRVYFLIKIFFLEATYGICTYVTRVSSSIIYSLIKLSYPCFQIKCQDMAEKPQITTCFNV